MIGPAQSDGPMVLVDDLDAPTVSDADQHHLRRVLRLRDGASIVLCDGRGSWRRARLGEPVGELSPLQRSVPRDHRVGVGFALAKGDRPELVTQKLTEIGVDVIMPLRTDRGVVRWDGERGARHVERLRRVAEEACCQSRRPCLPTVTAPLTLDEAVSAAAGLGLAAGSVALADTGAERVAAVAPPLQLVLVGPEGGWTDRERMVVGARVDLGDHVLRSETAAIVAGALLVAGYRVR